jgi:two-component system, sporulation sensor kinase E
VYTLPYPMPPKPNGKPSPNRTAGLDRVLGHLHQLDAGSLGTLADRLSRERTLRDAILGALQDAVILIDRQGEVQLINPAAEKLLGLPAGDSTPRLLWRLAPEFTSVFPLSASGDIPLDRTFTQELSLSYPTPRTVRLYARPLATLGLMLLVLNDQTEQQEANTLQLEQARLNALTQLAAGVAHELGNPLNALQIHLQVIERSLQREKLSAKGESIARSLRVAEGEVQRLDSIIRHFLQAVRPTPPHLQPADLFALLEEVLTVLRAELEGAKVSVAVELPGLVPSVMADAGQVKQVYFNIIKNAREAMEMGGTLRIRASSDQEWLRLQFIDSGCGIKAEELAHIFEPYMTTKPGGTGLGMMIAQKIVRAHGGYINVESEPGRGTTVTLAFPLEFRRFKPLAAPQG